MFFFYIFVSTININMGQYYNPIFLDNKVEGEREKIKAWMYSHSYGNGLKLMEHSWMKNPFVQTFEKQLTRRGEHYKSRVVWAGDYADEEPGLVMVDGEEKEINLNAMCDESLKIKPQVVKSTASYPYIVNHTKKQFVDKRKVPNVKGWQIHPLPLLTCEGNGRGGGDFHGESPLIGAWARDVISVEKNNPKDIIDTFDFEEIIFDLKEDE